MFCFVLFCFVLFFNNLIKWDLAVSYLPFQSAWSTYFCGARDWSITYIMINMNIKLVISCLRGLHIWFFKRYYSVHRIERRVQNLVASGRSQVFTSGWKKWENMLIFFSKFFLCFITPMFAFWVDNRLVHCMTLPNIVILTVMEARALSVCYFRMSRTKLSPCIQHFIRGPKWVVFK